MAKDAIFVIEISSDEDDDHDETPPRANVRHPAGTISAIKTEKPARPAEDPDCFILDFDPFTSIDLKKLVIEDSPADDEELSIVSEQGPVACRDYPHPRHLCANFPFKKTSHENYCQQCYCYVCDTLAPCKKWTGIVEAHCHASDHETYWRQLRTLRAKLESMNPK